MSERTRDRAPPGPDEGSALVDALVDGLWNAHLQAGGPAADAPLLRAALQALWRAGREGHVCVDLVEAFGAGRADDVRDRLAASPLVCTTGATARPLVLEGVFLYRRRDWRAEGTLADGLSERAARPPGRADGAAAPGAVEPASNGLNARQRQALEIASGRGLLVLSGGPGTGKTHTLAALVRAVLASEPNARVVLAAPTGKAAARLGEGLGPVPAAGSEAVRVATVHRLLGYRSGGRFQRHALLPVDADWVIVDECSMLDSHTAAHLVASLPADARLVLAGDRDQLASVQAGAFFGALCQASAPGLSACRVLLEENFRQRESPALLAFTAALREGREPPEPTGAGDDLRRIAPADPARDERGHWREAMIDALVEQAVARLGPCVAAAAAARDPEAAVGALKGFAACRVLTALRTGPAGAEALNRRIVRRLFGASDLPAPGRLLVVRRNLPGLELFNGDVGLVFGTPAAPRVVFEDGRALALAQLPNWEDAFVLTIHQAQGSEFDEVLLLPAPAGHPMATREALYTGATRARRRLVLFADRESVRDAAGKTGRRQASLLARLGGAHAGAG